MTSDSRTVTERPCCKQSKGRKFRNISLLTRFQRQWFFLRLFPFCVPFFELGDVFHLHPEFFSFPRIILKAKDRRIRKQRPGKRRKRKKQLKSAAFHWPLAKTVKCCAPLLSFRLTRRPFPRRREGGRGWEEKEKFHVYPPPCWNASFNNTRISRDVYRMKSSTFCLGARVARM